MKNFIRNPLIFLFKDYKQIKQMFFYMIALTCSSHLLFFHLGYLHLSDMNHLSAIYSFDIKSPFLYFLLTLSQYNE